MSETNIYRCSPSLTREFVTDCIYAKVVPYIHSSPGMGKSAIVRSIAEELNLKLIDHRLSTSAPEDMTGLPRFDEKGYAYFSPFRELFPLDDQEIPEGRDGWLVFFDEFPSAPRSVQAAAYKILLDRMVGQRKLHPNVVIVCAGNLATDKAIVNPIGTALQSRLVHIEMEIDFDGWMKEVAMKEGYDKRIISFLGANPSSLMNFNPDHTDKTFDCPRTWEFVNKLLKSSPDMDERRTPLFAGAISSTTAAAFFQFVKVFDSLIKMSDILKDPLNCPVPRENAVLWATVTSMVDTIDEKKPEAFEKMTLYANRFNMTFRIVFFRYVTARFPTLRRHPAFINASVELINYLS